MKLSPLDVQQMVFKSGWRGYDRSEVDRFLEKVAHAMSEQAQENVSLRERLGKLEAELAELRKSELALNRTLVSTQSLADELKQAAQRDATLIKREAELKAAETLREAQGELTAIHRELAELRKQRLLTIDRMRSTLSSFQRMLDIETADAEESQPHAAAFDSMPHGKG
jgi:cell division initiation protein